MKPSIYSASSMRAHKLLVIAITPLILEKGLIWFDQSKSRIEKATKAPSFWQRNSLGLEKGQRTILSEFTRKLSDFGYKKYQTVQLPGEFSQLGGNVTVFPINSRYAYRVEFNGNYVEDIAIIHSLENASPETALSKVIEKRTEPQSDLSSIKIGDYIVHLDHGIGRLYKICDEKNDNSDGNLKVYVLEYAAGDKLTVPQTATYKLSPYIGFSNPTIYRLGGNLWHRTKKKIRDDVIKTAKELLKIYAARELSERPPYTYEEDLVSMVEQNFEYQETPDQKSAIDDILSDMQNPTPMDRLVCGDVGFGKTEAAIRAAALAVSSGRQIAIIAPTTVLAWQHYQTFLSRFSNLPVSISLLSRIQKKAEQRDITAKLSFGKIDIVIGTHRLLQNDIKFKNLGLLIIDEEQRFGVRQKEKLKSLRAEVDILSLSATPIPRTLYFSLSGLKSISNIQTPPLNRLPIKTYVLPKSGKTIREAIQTELSRGGQIYYLHNRISTIDSTHLKLNKILQNKGGSDPPLNPRVAVAHARLPEQQLIRIIDDFRNKKYDILLATTIIENGLDLSNANTLIVEDATRLGLSQAHQLRGRIGRGDTQAYAYFLYRPKKLTEISKRRLETLQKYQELGSGYEIAMRDLEIRGAGNILGREQHGAINKIGLNLYCQMLNEAVEELKSQG